MHAATCLFAMHGAETSVCCMQHDPVRPDGVSEAGQAADPAEQAGSAGVGVNGAPTVDDASAKSGRPSRCARCAVLQNPAGAGHGTGK